MECPQVSDDFISWSVLFSNGLIFRSVCVYVCSSDDHPHVDHEDHVDHVDHEDCLINCLVIRSVSH